MSLLQYILAISFSLLILTVFLAALAKPILKAQIRLPDAGFAALLMTCLGSLTALALGHAYTSFRPTFTGFFAKKYQLMGWWIDVDFAAIWILGLALGYAIALILVLRKQIPNLPRLASLSLLTALMSPAILFAAELCLRADPSQVLAAFN